MGMDKLDRAFTSWRVGGPGDRAVAADYSKLESSIISTLRRVAGYPDPNKEGGTFDPNKLTSTYLSKLDTNKRVSFISDMAGLLWYRALPLSRLARKNLLSDDTRSVQNSSVCSDDSKEKVEKLMEHLDHTRDRLDTAVDLVLKRDSEIIELQSEISALKDKIISMKDTMLEKSVSAVQTVVKDEIQNYSAVLQTAASAVKQTCASALAPSKLRTAIATASVDRSTNLMVYGLPEGDQQSDRTSVKELFEHLLEAPVLSEVTRLGKRSGEGVRVVLRNREIARTILGKSATLKDSDQYQEVFVAPDRSVEERTERRELVAKLKERREHEPDKVWRIRRGSIVEKESGDVRSQVRAISEIFERVN